MWSLSVSKHTDGGSSDSCTKPYSAVAHCHVWLLFNQCHLAPPHIVIKSGTWNGNVIVGMGEWNNNDEAGIGMGLVEFLLGCVE